MSSEDFLPALSYVIVMCNTPQILLEVEYMMELLEPSWLTGEGTHYTLYSLHPVHLQSTYNSNYTPRGDGTDYILTPPFYTLHPTIHTWLHFILTLHYKPFIRH